MYGFTWKSYIWNCSQQIYFYCSFLILQCLRQRYHTSKFSLISNFQFHKVYCCFTLQYVCIRLFKEKATIYIDHKVLLIFNSCRKCGSSVCFRTEMKWKRGNPYGTSRKLVSGRIGPFLEEDLMQIDFFLCFIIIILFSIFLLGN